MQCLGKAAHLFQSGLGNLAHLLKFGAKGIDRLDVTQTQLGLDVAGFVLGQHGTAGNTYQEKGRDVCNGKLRARQNRFDEAAQGGPRALSTQPFFIGINDPLGGNPSGASFNPEAMTLFTKWRDLAGQPTGCYRPGSSKPGDGARGGE